MEHLNKKNQRENAGPSTGLSSTLQPERFTGAIGLRQVCGRKPLLVVVIDPSKHTFTTCDIEGMRHFARDDIFQHVALPGLAIEVASIFEKPKPRKS